MAVVRIQKNTPCDQIAPLRSRFFFIPKDNSVHLSAGGHGNYIFHKRFFDFLDSLLQRQFNLINTL